METGSLPPADEALINFTREITREAGRKTLEYFRSSRIEVQIKSDRTPTTNVELALETRLRAVINDTYPDATVIGEELEAKHGNDLLTFYLDPIDGTSIFIRGIPLYSILLGIHDEFGPAVGVIDVPALGETIWAGRGRGCYLNGTRVSVSEHLTLEDSSLMASGYHNWPIEVIENIGNAGIRLQGCGQGGYGYLLVASGRAEAMADPFWGIKVWDCAPMPTILHEAGGQFTNLNGEERIDSGSGIATNGHIHTELLALLNTR